MTGPTLDTIVAMLEQRKRDQGPEIGQMRELRDIYNGEYVIPLPELDRNEDPAVANTIAMGLDQSAMRIASVLPNVFYPPVRPNIKRSEDLARTRMRATVGWWQANKMDMKLRRRARWLLGYATAPVMLWPDQKRGIARWQNRDPLNTFPCLTDDPDELTPPDCIFTYQRTLGWLKMNYPDQVAALRLPPRATDSDRLDLVEYTDDEALVLGVIGWQPDRYPDNTLATGLRMVELHRLPNRAGLCLAVTPGRINLDRRRGQFDGMVGMYKTEAKITALELIAVERGIFPDTYLVSRDGKTATFIAGPFDGRTGQVNIIKDGDIKEMTPNPNFAATGMADRLERAQRITAGVPAEFGGESQTNVRTGKRGDAILSAVVDMPVQEAQNILAASLTEENKRAVAIAKGYFGSQRRSFYVSLNKLKGHVDYVPNEVFENDNNIVSYPLAGADQAGLIIGMGQRVGLGTMSKRTAQEIDPMISDPELERERVQHEAVEQALLASIQAQAQQGAIPPSDLARINELVLGGATLFDAVQKAQAEAQARQATAAPQGAPETQPGLAQPGQGAEQPAIPPPGQSQVNLSDLLNSLRRPQRESPAERAAG